MSELHPKPDELVDYLHAELPAERDAAIHAHVAGCTECAQTRDAETEITEQLRTLARAQERELPAHVVTAIRNGVRQAPSPWVRWRAAFRPAIALPAAAALALICYAGVFVAAERSHTAIDPAYYLDDHAALSGLEPLAQDDPIPPTLASDDEAR